MLLSPWKGGHRCHVLTWDTLVTIDVTGLPPYAWHKHILAPMLSKHCALKSCGFYKKRVCRVHGFAGGLGAIPHYDTLRIPAYELNVVYIHMNGLW